MSLIFYLFISTIKSFQVCFFMHEGYIIIKPHLYVTIQIYFQSMYIWSNPIQNFDESKQNCSKSVYIFMNDLNIHGLKYNRTVTYTINPSAIEQISTDELIQKTFHNAKKLRNSFPRELNTLFTGVNSRVEWKNSFIIKWITATRKYAFLRFQNSNWI